MSAAAEATSTRFHLQDVAAAFQRSLLLHPVVPLPIGRVIDPSRPTTDPAAIHDPKAILHASRATLYEFISLFYRNGDRSWSQRRGRRAWEGSREQVLTKLRELLRAPTTGWFEKPTRRGHGAVCVVWKRKPYVLIIECQLHRPRPHVMVHGMMSLGRYQDSEAR